MSSRSDPDNPEAILEEEKNRPSFSFNAKGEMIGFGSWYDCPHYDHSVGEMTARIGHYHHVCTCDMTASNQIKYCHDDGDDSNRSSHWKERTGFTMKGTMLQGSSRNSSPRKPQKVNFKISSVNKKSRSHFLFQW